MNDDNTLFCAICEAAIDDRAFELVRSVEEVHATGERALLLMAHLACVCSGCGEQDAIEVFRRWGLAPMPVAQLGADSASPTCRRCGTNLTEGEMAVYSVDVIGGRQLHRDQLCRLCDYEILGHAGGEDGAYGTAH